MIPKELEDYIRSAISKGYNASYIEKHLIKHGYNEHDARDAVSEVVSKDKKPQEAMRHSHHLLSTAIIILLILLGASILIAIIWFNSEPLRSLIDRCECVGNQTCVNGECLDPVCSRCEMLIDHECVLGECCIDLDCDDGDITTWDRCLINKTCFNSKITLCVKEDGYCPEGCTFEQDTDCDQCTSYDSAAECGIGMHCFKGRCVRNQELSGFQDCEPTELMRCETIDGQSFCPEQGTCSKPCDKCIEPICAWGVNKCVECQSDDDCIDGICEYYVCV